VCQDVVEKSSPSEKEKLAAKKRFEILGEPVENLSRLEKTERTPVGKKLKRPTTLHVDTDHVPSDDEKLFSASQKLKIRSVSQRRPAETERRPVTSGRPTLSQSRVELTRASTPQTVRRPAGAISSTSSMTARPLKKQRLQEHEQIEEQRQEPVNKRHRLEFEHVVGNVDKEQDRPRKLDKGKRPLTVEERRLLAELRRRNEVEENRERAETRRQDVENAQLEDLEDDAYQSRGYLGPSVRSRPAYSQQVHGQSSTTPSTVTSAGTSFMTSINETNSLFFRFVRSISKCQERYAGHNPTRYVLKYVFRLFMMWFFRIKKVLRANEGRFDSETKKIKGKSKRFKSGHYFKRFEV